MALRDDITTWLQANQPASLEDIVNAMAPLGHAQLQVIDEMDLMEAEGLVSPDPVTSQYTLVGGGGEAAPDQDAIDCLEAVVCEPCPTNTECENDVTIISDGVGTPIEEVERGFLNSNALVEALRCEGLRDKLIAAGCDIAAIDAMLDSIELANGTGLAWVAHYGEPGL